MISDVFRFTKLFLSRSVWHVKCTVCSMEIALKPYNARQLFLIHKLKIDIEKVCKKELFWLDDMKCMSCHCFVNPVNNIYGITVSILKFLQNAFLMKFKEVFHYGMRNFTFFNIFAKHSNPTKWGQYRSHEYACSALNCYLEDNNSFWMEFTEIKAKNDDFLVNFPGENVLYSNLKWIIQ